MLKNIRPLITCCILWVVAAIIVNAVIVVSVVNHRTPFTVENSVSENEEAIFVTDNIRTAGLVYRMNAQGVVEGLFSTKDFATLSDWKVSFVDALENDEYVVFTRTHDDNGRVVNQYCVAMMNEGMQITYLTPIFRFPMELNLTGFTAFEDVLYLTAVSDEGQQAYTYEVPTAEMISITGTTLDQNQQEAFDTQKLSVTETALQESIRPRFIVQADYDGEKMIVRYDNSQPGTFAMNTNAANVFNGRRMSIGQSIKASNLNLTYMILVLFAGVLVIILLFIVFSERLRIVYAVTAWEVFLLLLLGVTYYGVTTTGTNAAEAQYRRYELSALYNVFDGYQGLALSERSIYSSEEYQALTDRLRRRTVKGGMTNGALDILIVENSSGEVVLSAMGRNMDTVNSLYTRDVLSLTEDDTDGTGTLALTLQGQRLMILGADLSRAGYDGYVGYVVRTRESVLKGVAYDNADSLRWFFVLFFIGTLVGVMLLALQGSDLRQLRQALSRLSKGETGLEKPKVVGRDLNYMWNSVFEIEKNFDVVNRLQFVVYEAYYRFAPKSVERILGRESITEVHPNDAVCLNGAIAVLSTDRKKTLDTRVIEEVNQLLETVEGYRSEYDGIMLSNNATLSEMNFFFPDDKHNATGFGSDLMLHLKEQKNDSLGRSAMIAHFSTFLYGVAGTSEQNSVFLSSPELNVLTEYLAWFRELNLGLVVTETLLEVEKPSVDTRCIGFVFTDKNDREKRLKLYEVLDAKPVGVRSRRLRTKKRFAEALALFYEQDFYFARSMFTDILRESPDDLLSKWYVFECEYYLNDTAPGDFAGELHTENKES